MWFAVAGICCLRDPTAATMQLSKGDNINDMSYVLVNLLMSQKKDPLYQDGGKVYTLKCLSIGTLKTIDFPFVPNGKSMVLRCPNM